MRKINNKTELTELHREQVRLRKEFDICGIGHVVELDYDFMLKLEEDTIRLNANPRPKSSAGGIKNLAEMRQRGIPIIDNPKGSMLVVKIHDTYVIPDGLHTFRSTKELARMEGREAVGNYVVRLQIMTIPEYEYFKLFGDGFVKSRSTAIQATILDSDGKEIPRGALKTKQCQIADKLNSFSQGKYGGDRKTAADRTMHFHEMYRSEIEYVTSFVALMALKDSRENNSAVLSVFCDAIKRFGQPAKDFFRQFASLSYADEVNVHATRLLNWVKEQKIAARAGTENLIKGTSYWIAAYLLDWPTHRNNGSKVTTDTSRYFLKDVEEAQMEKQVEQRPRAIVQRLQRGVPVKA